MRLFVLSFTMLFVELALIRWTGSNVVHLSFFTNLVLLGSFLGIGLGFLRGAGRRDLFPFAPAALAALVWFVAAFPVQIARQDDDILLFGISTTGLPMWVMLPVVFIAVAVVMTMIGQGVARSFARFEPLEAYRIDIAGAIAGVAGFSALSAAGAPPVVWGVIAAALFAVLLRPSGIAVVPLVALVAALAVESLAPGATWSPYYRIDADDRTSDDRVWISVNGIPHQTIRSVETVSREDPIYSVPWRHVGNPRRVLVIGAGTGNDVAVALDRGARAVDAVEIDPELIAIGRRLHPDRPYSDPRVTLYAEDGRAFLERTERRFDLILFALPDSLTLLPGQSALRLESYLFTVEAIEAARDRLAPSGTFAMYNYYREEWLIDRLARTVEEAFGHAPCVDTEGDEFRLGVLTTASDPAALPCEPAPTVRTEASAPATDDHPFPYLRTRGVPRVLLATIALIVIASLASVRLSAGSFRPMLRYTDLFLMGLAFLLLETKSIVTFALLFGSTWFVNALVFGGILVVVLLAIEATRRWTLPPPPVAYALLLGSLLVAALVPQQWVLGLPFGPRLGAAVALAFAPVFLANLIFAERFRETADPTSAFGANLLGAMAGGLLEYVSLIVGFRALLIFVAIAYIGAALTRRRDGAGRLAVEAPTTGPGPIP